MKRLPHSSPTPRPLPEPMSAPKMKPIAIGKTPLHDALGVSPEYTRAEWMKIANQDEHLPSKLKALTPLAKEIGLDAGDNAPSTTNIIIVPQEIVKKYELKTQVIHDITPPKNEDQA